jgi:hypothetical protein
MTLIEIKGPDTPEMTAAIQKFCEAIDAAVEFAEQAATKTPVSCHCPVHG